MAIRTLDGKKCLVTGAASGIGRATAVAAAGRGAELVLTDVNEVGAELKFRGNELVNGYVKYVHDQRRGSEFFFNRPYAGIVTTPTLLASNFDNNPTLRQFFVADYNQDRIKAQATITPFARFQTVAVSQNALHGRAAPENGICRSGVSVFVAVWFVRPV